MRAQGMCPSAQWFAKIRVLTFVVGLAAAVWLACAGTAAADYLYRSSFSGPAELEAPRRAAVEQSTGNIFVVDSGHDRVLVFKPEGTSGSLLTEFGAGALDNPYGIAIDEAGGETEVYVSDAGNDRIVRFLSDEEPTPSFSVDAGYTSPAKGTGADEIADFESALALAPDGDLWVADRGPNVVKRFDATGAHVADSNFDGSTSPGGAFVGLLDIAASAGGDLYVLDATDDVSQPTGTSRVDRFAEDGSYLASLSPLGSESRAGAVAVNPDSGTVVVSGTQDAVYYDAAPTLHVFDSANVPVQELTVSAALYGTVRGLTFRDAASDFLYVVGDVGIWNGSPFGSPGIHSFEDATPPQATIDPVTPSSPTTATVTGTVDPEGEAATAWFEYKASAETDWTKTAAEDVGAGTDPVSVETELTGLEPGTTYEVRLTGSSPSGSKSSSVESFTTAALAPTVLFAWAKPGTDGATLKGRIDPGGDETTYFFEYGLTAAYGQTTAPGVIAPGGSLKSVAAEIEGLQPGTTYHFRVVAENAIGDDASEDKTFTTSTGGEGCPNEAFRTGPSALLGDCRAFELVTPAGAEADLRIAGGPSTPDGNAICFNTENQLLDSDPNGIKLGDDGFCSWRRPDGWETKWVTGPAPEKRVSTMGSDVYYLSPDGQRAVFASDGNLLGPDYLPKPPAASGGIPSAYMWEAGETRWLAPPPPPVGEPPEYAQEGLVDTTYAYRRPLAASEDLTHGIFASDLNLVPEDENNVSDVYEWYPGGIRVVSRDASGKAAGGRPPFDTIERYVAPEGTVSADGSRIFFLHRGAPLDGDAGEAPATVESVYMREGDEVTLVSPRRGSGADADVMFSGASLDGERAFLETTQQLTAEAKQDGNAIYAYDVSEDDVELVADAPGGVQLLGTSADGSTVVYRVLASDRLVVNRNGVDTVLGKIGPLDSALFFRVASPRYEQRALKITPDGRVVVFVSTGEFGDSPAGTAKVYRWAADEGLDNLSTGDDPQTQNASVGAYATFFPGDPREEFLHQHRGKTLSGRVVSEDGSRVFFETPEALVDRDVNGVTDVYEWHDGDVDLVTSGIGVKSLYFDSSADGKTVFFLTFNRVIPELDTNNRRDLYVARPGGGLPLPPSPPDCAGEACQPERGAPGVGDPGSRSGGEGNVSPAPRIGFGKKQVRRLGAKGRTRIAVSVTAPGRVTALLKGKVDGRTRTVAKATKFAKAPGTVHLTLVLSRAARKELRENGSLRLRLEVKHSRSDQTARKAVMLRD